MQFWLRGGGLFLFCLLLPVLSGHAEDGGTAMRRTADAQLPDGLELGIRFGFLSNELASEGPYSAATASGLYLEFPLRLVGDSLPVQLGATVSTYTFASTEARYSDSLMFAPGVSVAIEALRRGDRQFDWRVLPYFEQRHYIRRQRIDGISRIAYRPMSAAGIRLAQRRGRRVVTGAGLEYVVAWDDRPVQMFGFSLLLGMRITSRAPARLRGTAE